MRKVPLAGAAVALVLGLAGVAAFSVASQVAGYSAAGNDASDLDAALALLGAVEAA